MNDFFLEFQETGIVSIRSNTLEYVSRDRRIIGLGIVSEAENLLQES